jgi:hypothetical protein
MKDRKTRWNSTFERFYLLRDAVRKALTYIGSDISFTAIEIHQIKLIVQALRPVYTTVLELCKDNANLAIADALFSTRSTASAVIQFLKDPFNTHPIADYLPIISQTKIEKMLHQYAMTFGAASPEPDKAVKMKLKQARRIFRMLSEFAGLLTRKTI